MNRVFEAGLLEKSQRNQLKSQEKTEHPTELKVYLWSEKFEYRIKI